MKKSLFSLAWLPIWLAVIPFFTQKPAPVPQSGGPEPVAKCLANVQSFIGPGQSDAANCPGLPGTNGPLPDLPGTSKITASELDGGSFDPQGQPLFFKIKRVDNVFGDFDDVQVFDCGDAGTPIDVVLRAYNVPPGTGAVDPAAFMGHFSDCQTAVLVIDKQKPTCLAPPSKNIFCEDAAPLPWAGTLEYADNCGIASIDTNFEYLPSEQDFFQKKYGLARRVFIVRDCAGNAAASVQQLTVNYRSQFRLQFPDDLNSVVCDGALAAASNGKVSFFNENCAKITTVSENKTLHVIPNACYRILRTYRVFDLTTHNPAIADIIIPNPGNSTVAPNIWVGADANNQFAWAFADPGSVNVPTVGPRTVIFPAPLTGPNQIGTPALSYTQVINVVDNFAPTALPMDYTYCDMPPNDPNQWNSEMPYNPYGITGTWDPIDQSKDLKEAVVDLSITATDDCSGDDVSFRFLLFLDLNSDGNMETTISSESTVWGFGIKEDEIVNGHRIGRITRDVETDDGPPLFNHKKVPGFTLPKGRHKIKWIVEDACGNDFTKEVNILVGQCAPPSIVCHNYLKINQLNKFPLAPDTSATRQATQFLRAASDDKTPSNQLEYALRDPGINPGTGFPVDAMGKPVKSLAWRCEHLGQRPLELWARDPQGNTATCATAVFVKDGTNLCKPDSLVGDPVVEYRGAETTGFAAADGFELFQNRPNPFSGTTEIPFNLPADGAVRLRVFDALGRLVLERNGQFPAGPNSFLLEKNDFPKAINLGFYEVLSVGGSAARRMVFERD